MESDNHLKHLSGEDVRNAASKFSSLSPAARCIWAKSADGLGYGLLAHMLDVAATAEALLEHEPESTLEHFAELFGLPPDSFARHVATLVGLHDFGKAIPGFQAKWPQGQEQDEIAGLTFGSAALRVTDHACASAALLWERLSALGVEPGWGMGVLQAISAHHGYNFHRTEITAAKPPFEGVKWEQVRQELFESYWQTLDPGDIPQVEDVPLAAVQWLAGLTSVADWIGSNPDWFPLVERADSLTAHFTYAKLLAAKALQEIGWGHYRALLTQDMTSDELIRRIVNQSGLGARPLQAEGDRLLLASNGPTLLLVEAPMGEGKTELAFLAHLRLQAANRHRGLYVALPTQATGNALFDRAVTFLNAFSDQHRLDIQLVHGGAMLDERVQRLRDIHDRNDDSVGSAAWFSRRRRPLLSAYGVGTIDQALFATLNVKHHFVRLWGLANRVVVLDEVHAYDTYTSGLMESLLRWLKALGSSVVLMSATLPEKRRRGLLQAWGVAANDMPELSYPRLVLADDRGLSHATFVSRSLPPIYLQAIGEELADLAACAHELLASGGYGAVIVNTVNRAQSLYQELQFLQEDGVQLLLFHARFPVDDRSARERQVLDTFGKRGLKNHRPGRALLIATQVAEQSLDLDFDFMITDLAPVDLVLQRAGRLHRHQRVRPQAHGEAQLFVAGLQMQQLPDFKKTAWEFVYEPYILGRTWAFLSREEVLLMPRDIDRLVQTVYGDTPLPQDLQADALAYIEGEAYGQHLARLSTERQQALNIAISPEDEPQSAYLRKPRGNEEGEGLGLTNRTRLGDDAVALVPIHRVSGGWSVQPGGEPFDIHQSLPDTLARQLYGRQIKLSRTKVVVHFSEIEAPPAFAEHPLLRHLRPLELKDGCYLIGKLLLRLDEHLGLIYEESNTATQPKDKE